MAETAAHLLLLSPAQREDLIAYLAEHPTAGVLIEGTGGIRKLRWGPKGAASVAVPA